MDNSQQLLTEVFYIYNKNEQAAILNGDRFNIFEILNRAKHENSFSSFIAELLNPEGTHGCKEVFLRMFIGSYLMNGMSDFLEGRIEVRTEFFTGFKKEQVVIENKKTADFYGRIDIILKNQNNGKLIIIENKVDADDQEEQLKRYNNYALSQTKPFIILYLTLDGKEATIKSAVDLKSNNNKEKVQQVNYYCLSYKDDILGWLEACIKETHAFPMVRETIRQYIFLIRKLTKQSTTHKMGDEIQKLISQDSKNFEAASIIAGEFDNTKKLLLETFWQEVIKEIKTKYDFEVKIDFKKGNVNLLNTWCPSIFIPIRNSNKCIGMEPLNGKHWKTGYSKLFIGIYDPKGGHFPEKPFEVWEKILETNNDFNSVDTLAKIVDLKEREAIKHEILKIVQDFMNEVNNTVDKSLQSDNEIGQ